MTGFTRGLLQNGHDITGIFVRNIPPASGNYVNACPAGGLVLDIVAGVLYQNTGTVASPSFTTFGTVIPSGATLPAVTNSALPAADPHVVGRLWSNSGVVTVSAG